MVGRTRGFTLMELLMVIVILAVLLLIVMGRMQAITSRAREAALRDNLRYLRLGIASFTDDVGGYPTELRQITLPRAMAEMLPAVDANGTPMNREGYHGPYITPDHLPRDPFSVNGDWQYDARMGTVTCNTNRIALDGTAYSTW